MGSCHVFRAIGTIYRSLGEMPQAHGSRDSHFGMSGLRIQIGIEGKGNPTGLPRDSASASQNVRGSVLHSRIKCGECSNHPTFVATSDVRKCVLSSHIIIHRVTFVSSKRVWTDGKRYRGTRPRSSRACVIFAHESVHRSWACPSADSEAQSSGPDLQVHLGPPKPRERRDDSDVCTRLNIVIFETVRVPRLLV